MSLPAWTTTVTVHEPVAVTGDPYTGPSGDFTTVATGVHAHLSRPGGSEDTIGGEQETVTGPLLLDPCPQLTHRCEITDDTTGLRYEVSSVVHRSGVGLDHTVATVRRIQGAVP